MNRRVLIIGSPQRGENHLVGVKEDVRNFKRYIQSSIGGVYTENEVQYFEHPTSQQVRHYLSKCEQLDILIIYFSGHGFRYSNSDWICLNENESLSVKTFMKSSAKRRLILIDACRTPIDTREYGDVISGIGYHFSTDFPEHSKRLYCEYVDKSPTGTALIFSTAENMPALDSENGGVYTKSLMTVLHNWPNTQNEKVITIGQAFRQSLPIAKGYEPSQQPRLYYCDNKDSIKIPFGINPAAHLKQS